MEIQRNFIGSKMNKDLDERLLPKGVYKDALNIDITQDSQSEGGSAKNTLGNTEIASLTYNGQPLSSDAKTIGSFEDGANETLYWFTTDPTLDVDIISSFNFNNNTLRYHYVGDLGFDDKTRINDVDLIDELLFFTDDKNPPRRINISRNYSGNDADELNVIVAPPEKAPEINLIVNSSEQNYIKDKFISFAYRYRYKDGEYSALSQFSKYAFSTSKFKINYSTYLMEGMENAFNAVDVSFNTGSKHVVAIDLCFKLSDQNIINVIERFYKDEQLYGDNENAVVRFDNKKIYTTLTDDQLLRRYDNVPRAARTQCRMGNRIFYGNTLEGYDVNETIDIDYEAISEDSGITDVESSESDGVSYGFGDDRTVNSSTIDIDLDGVDLTNGSTLLVSFDVNHIDFDGSTYDGAENNFSIDYAFNLPRDYSDANTLSKDPVFIDTVVSSLAINDCSNSYSLTDKITCQIVTDGGWDIVDRGITSSDESVKITESNNVISLQIPAFKYQETATPANEVIEYLSVTSNGVVLLGERSNQSLHSDRDFELAIEYQDEYKRSTTALVNQNNTVYISPDKSTTKNFVRAEVKHSPPSWAKYFRFLIKPSKGLYDIVYSNIYFQDPSNGFWWFKLEGENINKVKEGDVLYIKTDSDGATKRRIKATVLEIKVNEKDFIEGNKNEQEQDIIEPTGLYMRLSPSAINVLNEDFTFINYPQVSANSDSFSLRLQPILSEQTAVNGFKYIGSTEGSPNLLYPLFYAVDDSAGNINFVNYDIPAGSVINIFFEDKRDGSGSRGGSRYYRFDREFVANEDYENFEDWFRSSNIDITKPTNNPAIESSDDDRNNIRAEFLETKITYTSENEDIVNESSNFVPSFNQAVTQLQFVELNGNLYLSVKSGTKGTTFRRSKLYVKIEVQRGNNIFAFETEPQEVDGATFFEGSQSFNITNGNHEGNIQNQTSSQPAVIDLDFHDCYTFGNGVESVKVSDSIAGAPVQLGERVSAVSREEYREIRRFSNISYSGVYNLETNLNRLNEFNLGLANFKVLEQLYGDLNKLHAHQTDMLAIQEDKISYVLTGKDLLTDARGDSAITSVPDVLGNQIARSEEFGISNNPESFASYGYYKFFTDAKRNSVISLTGNSYRNDKVEVISDIGMKNWFRDLFLNEFNTEKIGAYDPFSNMYTLTSGGGEKPKTINNVSCGLDLNQKNSNSTIEYNVQYSNITGNASIDYDFSSGSATIEVVYDGSTVINQSISGQGAVSFSKDKINVSSALVTITPSNATYSISINCVDEVPLTVIKAILNTDTTSGETIESAYSWSDSGYTSPRYKRDVTFEEDGVSLYDVSSGSESQGFIPSDGATISMFSVRNSLNTFDNSNVTFKYLLSNTLYTEEQLSSISLQSLNTNEVSDTVYDASFTFDRSGGETYLYLVWDYRLSDLTLIKAVLNSNTLSGETIRNSFSWSETYFESQKYIDDTTLEADEVSLYETTDGVESQGFIPKEGATVKMLSEQTSSTTLDNSIVEFKYLLSNTLYTEQQLSSLSFQSIPKEQIVSTNNYKGEFTYSNPNNFSYLYLIWEYPIATLECDDTLRVSEINGIYEIDIEIGVETGELVLELNSQGIPDRFQIEYDGQIVADSLFVGDDLPFSFFENEIINATQLDKFVYNGTNFDAAGTESVNFDAGDIAVSDGSETRADGSGTGQIGVVANYPSSTALASDGNVKLSFDKTNAFPQTAKLIVTGVNTGTVWNLLGIECPSGVIDTYSYSVEGGTSSISNACTLANQGNFGTTLWSTSNALDTGIFLYNTQNGAETQNSGDYAMNGFYGTIIDGNTASIQISSGEVVSINFC